MINDNLFTCSESYSTASKECEFSNYLDNNMPWGKSICKKFNEEITWNIVWYKCKSCKKMVDKNKNDYTQLIQNYIDKCKYSWKVEDVINGYKQKQNGSYVSFTMEDCIKNVGEYVKYWIKTFE